MSRAISRRTFLQGAGAALGLPLLEAMGATLRAQSKPVRMAFLYMANGVHPHAWTPKETGKDFRLTPLLEPLATVKDDVLVLTELWNAASNHGDGHYVKTGGWLTGTTITKTTGSELCSGGVSMDQLAAQQVGNLTPLPSLELSIEPVTSAVDANVGYTRLYGSHISWSTPTTPVAREINPKLAFDRLFRRAAGRRTSREDRSVLDLVLEDSKGLSKQVGTADRRKLDEYFESVRAVEKRIEFDAKRRKEGLDGDPESRKAIDALGGRLADAEKDPANRRGRDVDPTAHVRLMLDLLVLAVQTDMTRIATFMFANAVSNRNFSFLAGVRGGHHQISHHENNPVNLEQYKKIGIWHVAQYAYLLEQLKAIKEGEGTLLDNSMIVFGAGMRDGHTHNPVNLPIVLAGRAGGTLAPGRHLVFEKKTPLCNLYRSMLRRMGCPVDSFGDSTGELPELGA